MNYFIQKKQNLSELQNFDYKKYKETNNIDDMNV